MQNLFIGMGRKKAPLKMTQLKVLDICLEARGNLFLSTSCEESRQVAYVLFH